MGVGSGSHGDVACELEFYFLSQYFAWYSVFLLSLTSSFMIFISNNTVLGFIGSNRQTCLVSFVFSIADVWFRPISPSDARRESGGDEDWMLKMLNCESPILNSWLHIGRIIGLCNLSSGKWLGNPMCRCVFHPSLLKDYIIFGGWYAVMPSIGKP